MADIDARPARMVWPDSFLISVFTIGVAAGTVARWQAAAHTRMAATMKICFMSIELSVLNPALRFTPLLRGSAVNVNSISPQSRRGHGVFAELTGYNTVNK